MLAALIPLLGPVLDKLFPDASERQDAANRMMELAAQQDGQQVEVNKIEAASGNLFIAGWRPFIGWVCGLGLLWAFLGLPITSWAVTVWWPGTPLPQIVTDNLMELVLAMLGLGSLRSFEKLKGVAK